MNKNLEEIKRLLNNGQKRIVIDLLQDNYDPFHKMMEQYIKENHVAITGWSTNLPRRDSECLWISMDGNKLNAKRSSISTYYESSSQYDNDLYFKATDFFKEEKGIKKKLEL